MLALYFLTTNTLYKSNKYILNHSKKKKKKEKFISKYNKRKQIHLSTMAPSNLSARFSHRTTWDLATLTKNKRHNERKIVT